MFWITDCEIFRTARYFLPLPSPFLYWMLRISHMRASNLEPRREPCPMPTYTTADIRNVLLAGHGASGKTTLVDAMLLAAGAVNRKASVVDGNSFSDFEKEEKEHKHSIFSSILHCDHQGKRINLIDTPGSPD